ncbi:MAG: hypothetical protein GEV03_07130 [Streptosporangiales bacterium]|nr:hypothetical protein [Streptosporangiales bacterium]
MRRTDEELSFFMARMRAIVERRQLGWTDSEQEEEQWFSRLRLTSANIDPDKATFLFVDGTDGRRYGYRWWIRDEGGRDALADPDESLMLFDVHLEEDVAGSGGQREGWTYRARPPDRDGVQWIGDPDPPAPSVELGDFEIVLRDIVLHHQRAWKESEHEPERRFSQLELVSDWIDREAVRFVLADKDGNSYGYRWRIQDDLIADPDRAATLLASDLREDVRRLGHGEPDPDGVRWFSQEPLRGPPRARDHGQGGM